MCVLGKNYGFYVCLALDFCHLVIREIGLILISITKRPIIGLILKRCSIDCVISWVAQDGY